MPKLADYGSAIQLLISLIQLLISLIHLVISPIQLMISTIHLGISTILLEISLHRTPPPPGTGDLCPSDLSYFDLGVTSRDLSMTIDDRNGGRMCEKLHQLLAVGRWFPPGTPVSSTRKLISSSFHRLDMTLAVAEALHPNKPNRNCWGWNGVIWGSLLWVCSIFSSTRPLTLAQCQPTKTLVFFWHMTELY